jgi:hypothetical protein
MAKPMTFECHPMRTRDSRGRFTLGVFTAQEFILLSFDFKGWGESDGPLVAIERLVVSMGELGSDEYGSLVMVQKAS